MIRVRMQLSVVIRYWLPAAAWSVALLLFSGSSASSEHSGAWLRWILARTTGPLDPADFAILNMAVRKVAHLVAYGLLGALDFRAVRGGRAGWNLKWAGTALALAGAVAATDELIQSFVPSRTGVVSDVLLDVTGAATVLMIWMLFSRRMKRSLVALLLSIAAVQSTAAQLPALKREVLSQVYTIEKKYRSMEGPASVQQVFLGEGGEPELLWLIGVKTEMVKEDGTTPQLPELMCHVNVDIDAQRHRALFGMKRLFGTRVVTLSQGMLGARVPDGFGFPISSTEPLKLVTQVLNHNIDRPKSIRVRHRVTFEYVRDRDLTEPIKPLLNVGASGMVLLADPLSIPIVSAEPAAGGHTGEHTGASCLMLARAPNAMGTASDYVDPQGRKLTGHWIVPPGRQVNHTDVTWFMSLPFDSLLHYAAVHLHPFAESLTMRDVTEDKTIFTAYAKNPKRKVGLDHVDSFISSEGVPIYRDHKYELISVYNNTTKTTHDSMASVFLGIEDREFAKPSAEDLTARTMELEETMLASSALLKTSAGEFGVHIMREEAPRTARQFVRLVRSGQLKGAQVTKIEKDGDAILITFSAPTTPERRRLIQNLPLERGIAHDRGTLSLCPSDGEPEVTFQVVLGRATALDGKCTAFAQLGPGSASLAQIAAAAHDAEGKPLEAIEITAADLFEVVPSAVPSM